MIDWITAKLPLEHSHIPGGVVLILSADGEVEKSLTRRTSIPGSHFSSFTVQSYGAVADGKAQGISISGNPSKFLQGHNVFGSDDLISLVAETVRRINIELELGISEFDLRRVVDSGQYIVSRIDINYSFQLGSQTDVQAWLAATELKSRSRHGRAIHDSGTVYWGKKSSRYCIKAYSKYLEISSQSKDHRLHPDFENTPIKDWAKNILRIELMLRGKELEELDMRTAKNLNLNVRQLFDTYLKKIEMNGQIPIKDKRLSELPTKVRATYLLWGQGHKLFDNKTKTGVLSKATFYRHQKVLKDFGIDIAIACDDSPTESSNVVPLVRVLAAQPASIPDWAFTQGLVHRSAMRV